MREILKSLIITVIITASITNATSAEHRKSTYSLIVGRSGFASIDGKNYLSIEVYLNNYSNDTLYYRGADCDNLLFSVRGKPYFHLAKDVCRQNNHLKAVLPPHRSQKMKLSFTADQTPNRNVQLLITMKLYKWNGWGAKQGKVLYLSDSTVLHCNINHQNYYSIDDFEALEKKQETVLPDKDIYLLTDKDRKLYTLSVERAKVSVPRDTTIITFKDIRRPKKTKVVTVPVILHNNAEDTLRFYSMSCSWFAFWGADQKSIGIAGWPCDSNFPVVISIAPHKSYGRNLNIIYDLGVKNGNKYRISMSLLKVLGKGKWDFDFWPGDYVRFNKIWTDELSIR